MTKKDLWRKRAEAELRRSMRREMELFFESFIEEDRSLLDLLDGENARFNSQFQFQSAAAVHYFSAYQLLAHMGRLLSTLGVAAPAEVIADHVEQTQRSLFHVDIEPLRQ